MTAKEQYPFIFSGAFSQEASDGFSVASSNNKIRMSRILRSAGDMWLIWHRALTARGYSPLDATEYLLNQTETKQVQPPAQPQPAPPPFPQMQSPFAPPMNGAPRANS